MPEMANILPSSNKLFLIYHNPVKRQGALRGEIKQGNMPIFRLACCPLLTVYLLTRAVTTAIETPNKKRFKDM
jgi:hypothetical protein